MLLLLLLLVVVLLMARGRGRSRWRRRGIAHCSLGGLADPVRPALVVTARF